MLTGINSRSPITLTRASRTSACVFALSMLLVACGDGGAASPAATSGPDATSSPSPNTATERTEASDGDGEVEFDAVTLRVASPAPEDSPAGATFEWWQGELSERSGGRVSLEPYHLGTLLAGTDILPGTIDGRTELGMTYNVYHPAELPALNIVSLPFVTSDTIAVIKAVDELYRENEVLEAEFENQNLKPLFFVPNGSATIGSTSEINSLDDFEGTRYRATGHTATILDAVNADSVFIEFAELYESMDRAVVDGWAGVDVSTIVGAGLHEVTPHFLASGIGSYAVGAVVMNLDEWNALPAETQQLMEEVSEDYPDWVEKEFANFEAAACEEILAQGLDVAVLPESEVDAWSEAVGDSVYEALVDAASDAGISEDDYAALRDQYVEAVKKFEPTTDYVDGVVRCAERQ